MLKNCVALNKEKAIASLRHQVTIRTIRTMTWYFHIADFCTDWLGFPNNREFARRNRVYGHLCWNYFWKILSYRQKGFWRMWDLQNRLFHITDKTLNKALVNIPIGWYNFHRSNRHELFQWLSGHRPPQRACWPSANHDIARASSQETRLSWSSQHGFRHHRHHRCARHYAYSWERGQENCRCQTDLHR